MHLLVYKKTTLETRILVKIKVSEVNGAQKLNFALGSLPVPDILLLCSMGKAGEVEMERDIAWGTTWNGNSNK